MALRCHRRDAAGHARIGAGALKGRDAARRHLRDLVHAIPCTPSRPVLLTVAKAGKKNMFSGRVLEIEGLPDLKVEQAFELSMPRPSVPPAGCTVKLNPEPIAEYLRSTSC